MHQFLLLLISKRLFLPLQSASEEGETEGEEEGKDHAATKPRTATFLGVEGFIEGIATVVGEPRMQILYTINQITKNIVRILDRS